MIQKHSKRSQNFGEKKTRQSAARVGGRREGRREGARRSEGRRNGVGAGGKERGGEGVSNVDELATQVNAESLVVSLLLALYGLTRLGRDC